MERSVCLAWARRARYYLICERARPWNADEAVSTIQCNFIKLDTAPVQQVRCSTNHILPQTNLLKLFCLNTRRRWFIYLLVMCTIFFAQLSCLLPRFQSEYENSSVPSIANLLFDSISLVLFFKPDISVVHELILSLVSSIAPWLLATNIGAPEYFTIFFLDENLLYLWWNARETSN